MWDGERPKQSLEDPKAIELAWWGRGARPSAARLEEAERAEAIAALEGERRLDLGERG